MMKAYRGSKLSGVSGYELANDSIILKFTNDKFLYLYDYTTPGKIHVDKMKELATTGKGLSTYVNKNVRGNYKRKWLQLQKCRCYIRSQCRRRINAYSY